MDVTVATLSRADSILNQLAAASALADPLCSRSEWVFSYHQTIAAHRTLHLKATEDSVLTLAGYHHPTLGPLLEPVESHWFFGRPLLGPDSVELLKALLHEPHHRHQRPCVAISGIDLEGPLLGQLLRLLAPRYEVGCLEPIRFRSAALHDGPEGFLGRRSRKFRGNLRRAIKKGGDTGLEFERCIPRDQNEAHKAFERMVSVERTSWKGLENCGMTEEPYLTFYRSVYMRMSENHTSRAIFARVEGRDIGFVMGGVDGTSYRGQQFSFAADREGLSLGNLLQWEMIQWLCENNILRYDLGSVLEYKTHWAEIETQSHTLVWRPNV
jgi:hypothetical protein